MGLRVEAQPAITADGDHPRGTSLSNGGSRIERMVVVAIAGMLGAMAVPHLLGQLPKYRLNGAVRGKDVRVD
jgi:hypothetical protein